MGVPLQITDYTSFNHPPTLIGFFEGSDLQAWENAFSVQCAQIEQCLFDVMTQCGLTNAIGAQLDLLGVSLGLSRNGLDDVTYKVLLQLQAAINQEGGTPEAIVGAMRTILGILNVVYMPLYFAGFPATFALFSLSTLGIGTQYTLLDSSGNTMVDSSGNIIDVGVFVEISPTLVAQLVPAGVQVDIADALIDKNANFIVDSNGNEILVLTAAAAA